MREHEVPTHVQAEDRVLLWFTFPQIVALTAVCALSYGAYRYAPIGSSEARMALAVVLGLLGIATVVGKIGGRRLPLVVADLLKYRLGARRYAGPPAQLVRSEPPAPVPGPLRLMARRARRAPRRTRSTKRREGERRNGRMPFRPHGWFGKRSQRREKGNGNGLQAATQGAKRRRNRKTSETPDQVRGRLWLGVVTGTALAVAVATVPQAALADGPDGDDGWSSAEIEFQPSEPVPGRRIFVDGLRVSGNRAAVTLRAATGLELRVRAFGGPQGRELRFWGRATLVEGERTDYSLPLSGESPSFTFSWEDELGQAGAVTLKDGQIPYPLPAVEGELCNLRVTSLGWTPGSVEGAVESDCVSTIEEMVELPTSAGHHSETVTAAMGAGVTAIAGTLTVAGGGSQTSASFIPDGETRFRLPVGVGEAVHALTMEVDLEAALRIAVPPLVRLTHHPERTEERTRTVRLVRPGASRTVSETVTVTHDDGTTTQHVVTATLSIPSKVVDRDVTLAILHPERVEAEVAERSPITRSRDESLALASGVGSDAPFEVLTLPEPEPEPVPAEQTPGGGELSHWFDLLGWEWPW